MHQFDIIRKTYRNFTLETPSLEFPDKGLVVLLGDNGAGKSTLMKILSGRLRGDRKDKANASLRSAGWRSKVFYLSETTDFSGKLEEIADGFSVLYPRFDRAQYDAAFAAFGLSGKKKYRELSDGMKAKFKIAVAFSINADVYFFDEVTNGMDLKTRAAAYAWIHRLAETKTVFFSTHIFDKGFEDYERVILMDQGKITADVGKEQRLVLRENRLVTISATALSDGETPLDPVEVYRRSFSESEEAAAHG